MALGEQEDGKNKQTWNGSKTTQQLKYREDNEELKYGLTV